MRTTSKRARPANHALRLIVTKPGPDHLVKDADVLDRILSEGFSYTRQLCRDSVGTERPSILVRMSAELGRGRDRKELHEFIQKRLDGKSLHDVGTCSDVLADIMSDAEEAGIVRLRESKR